MTTERDRNDLHIIGAGFRWFLLYALALLLAMVAAKHAHAQTAPPRTFTASVTTGTFPISTVLSWSVPDAVSCTAGSTPGWTGSVPTSGTRTLTGINVDLRLTLVCVLKGSVLVSWVPGDPVVGAAVTGWRINYWQGTASPTFVDLDVPAATAYRIEGVAPGAWFVSVQARSAGGAGEAKAAVPAPYAVVAGNYSASIDIDGTAAVPNPPASVTVTDAQAYDIRPSSTGALLAQRVGVVKPGTSCNAAESRKVGTVTFYEVPREAFDMVNFSNGADKWVARVWARCL